MATRRPTASGQRRRLTMSVALVGIMASACASVEPNPPTPAIVGYHLPTNPPIPASTRIPVPSRIETPAPTFDPDVFRIAVVSCLRNSSYGPALEDVASANPELLLWLGDNIYGDTADPSLLRRQYDYLARNPRFQALSSVPATMAVWDDHDFGWDNANRTWEARDTSKAEFLRFWGATPDDPRWDQPGVYSSRTFGSADRTVQVILLDNRYNLDPYDYAGTDPGRTILGDVQWAWLRERLSEPATIRIIGSGIQVVQDYDLSQAWEGWGDTPLERERLFELIREMRVPGVVFVSGDMHFAELTRAADDPLGYPTYDLTASGLDQIEYESEGEWVNPNRIGELLNTNRKFGTVDIDWSPADPEIHLQIHDGDRVHLEQIVKLSELQPG